MPEDEGHGLLSGIRWLTTGKDRYGRYVRPYRKLYDNPKQNFYHLIWEILINDRLLVMLFGGVIFIGLIYSVYNVAPALIGALAFAIPTFPIFYILMSFLMKARETTVVSVGFEGQTTRVDIVLPDSDTKEEIKWFKTELTHFDVYKAPDFAFGGKPGSHGIRIKGAHRMETSGGSPVFIVNDVVDNKTCIGSSDVMASGLAMIPMLGDKWDYIAPEFNQYIKELAIDPRLREKKGIDPNELVKANLIWDTILDMWKDILTLNEEIQSIIHANAVRPIPVEDLEHNARNFLVQYTKPFNDWIDEYAQHMMDPDANIPVGLRLMRSYQIMSSKRTIWTKLAQEMMATDEAAAFETQLKTLRWGRKDGLEIIDERDRRRKIEPKAPILEAEEIQDEVMSIYNNDEGFKSKKGKVSNEWRR